MRNACLDVHVAGNAVRLASRAHDWEVASLITLVDERDVGDLYTPAPRPHPCEIRSRPPRRIHRGPLRGELRLGFRVLESQRRAAIADLEIGLVLDAGSPMLQIEIVGENRSENHRLRIAFQTGLASPEVWADAAFGPVRRRHIQVSEAERAIEQPPPTAPLHRYVSVFNGSSGVTVLSDGLAEYEARDDGTVLITLVRAVGALSRNDLPERPGHAGWPSPTPGAQCLGSFGARLAIMPHGARTAATLAAIEHAADDFLVPLRGFTLRSALHAPEPVEGPELVGEGVILSTIKPSEDGEWMVLRCVNVTDDPKRGEWRLPFDIEAAKLARLDETPLGDLPIDGGAIGFDALPHDIVTILVR